MANESNRHVSPLRVWLAGAMRSLALRRDLVILLVVALALRLVVALTMNPGFGDQQEYLSGANRLLDGQPLPTLNNLSFVRQPGYSVFIAAIWLVSPERGIAAIMLAQTVLSTATCFLVYALARIVDSDRRTALLAGWLSALYPYFLFEVSTVGTECLFAFLVVFGTYYFARGLRKESVRWRDLGVGVFVYAVGMLVRPNLAPTEALLGLFVAWRYRSRPRVVATTACAMILGTLLVTLPWSVAVARQGLGHVFLSDGGGVWYYVGHRDYAIRLYCDHEVGKSEEMDPVQLVARTLPRSEQVGLYWRTALRWDAEHPSAQLCLALGKFWNYWRPWVEPRAYSRLLFLISLGSFPILVSGLIGLWRKRADESGAAMVVAANVVGGTLTAMAYSTQIRYRIPAVDVLLMPYAAYAIMQVLQRAASWRSGRSATA